MMFYEETPKEEGTVAVQSCHHQDAEELSPHCFSQKVTGFPSVGKTVLVGDCYSRGPHRDRRRLRRAGVGGATKWTLQLARPLSQGSWWASEHPARRKPPHQQSEVQRTEP